MKKAVCLLAVAVAFSPDHSLAKGDGPKHDRNVAALIRVVEDLGAERRAREDAMEALGKLGEDATAAVPALIEAMDDKDSSIRAAAIGALGRLGPVAEAAVPALIGALKDYEDVSANVPSNLARIGPVAVPALVEALTSPNPNVRRWSAEALGDMGPPAGAAVGALVGRVRDGAEEWEVRRQAIFALGEMYPASKAALPDLVRAMDDEEVWIRKACIEAFVAFGPDARPAIPKLEKALEDEKTRREAKDALKRLGAWPPRKPAAITNAR